MNYVNDRFQELMGLEMNQKALEVMKKDVDAFMPGFSDSPEKLSRWGHHYFCDDDGGRLIFDLNSPKEHRCVVCGKVYRDETQNGVWITFYRNRAVVMTLVSALIYKATGETKYRDYAVRVMEFYAEHYHEFQLHSKENVLCESYDNMVWGCGKMMPQGLNEAIVAIRFIQTIEILRDELDSAWLERIHQKLFREMFRLMAPQAVAIHNISCWSLSAIGVMGLAMHDQEMIDYAFKSQFNMHEQLKKGVTKDGFWYEGSIHYNFFLLEGVSYLFLFSKIYDYDFGQESTAILERMFVQAYQYAFDNLYLPNPNDGWPDLNLKTFSYVYHTAARAFGEYSPVGNILKIIEADPAPRTTLPLSEPYYCCGTICLERLLFNIDFNYADYKPVPHSSTTFPTSNFAMLRNDSWNVFLKYGLNGRSHAHPDIMNVEVMYKKLRLSRDLSNAGYQSRLCNEWHRKTLAHNTVCWNGTDITSVEPGKCLLFENDQVRCKAENVYEGIDYTRELKITENFVLDRFQVEGKTGVYDYTFHFEPGIELSCDLPTEAADLGFSENGYQHVLETKKVKTDQNAVVLRAQLGAESMQVRVDLQEGQELFLLKTKDNPVNRIRNTVLIRSVGDKATYQMQLTV